MFFSLFHLDWFVSSDVENVAINVRNSVQSWRIVAKCWRTMLSHSVYAVPLIFYQFQCFCTHDIYFLTQGDYIKTSNRPNVFRFCFFMLIIYSGACVSDSNSVHKQIKIVHRIKSEKVCTSYFLDGSIMSE